jgi:hypothetical protein
MPYYGPGLKKTSLFTSYSKVQKRFYIHEKITIIVRKAIQIHSYLYGVQSAPCGIGGILAPIGEYSSTAKNLRK